VDNQVVSCLDWEQLASSLGNLRTGVAICNVYSARQSKSQRRLEDQITFVCPQCARALTTGESNGEADVDPERKFAPIDSLLQYS
jgi:hypothetical protein